PWPVPLSLTVKTPSSRTPALSHFWIRRSMRVSLIRCFRKRIIKNIVHPCAVDSGDECVQRIVLAALGPEPVREAEEVFLVDRVQHRACRLLDDLVFECGNCERALLTISLRYVMSPIRQSQICCPMEPGLQVRDLAIEVCLVVLPCQPIHTRCGISLEVEECHPE